MSDVKPKMSTLKKVILVCFVVFFVIPVALKIAGVGKKTPDQTAQPQTQVVTAEQNEAARQAAEAKAEQERQDAAKWQDYKDKATALIHERMPAKSHGDYEVDWQNSSQHSIRLLLSFKDKAPKLGEARSAALYSLRLALKVLTDMSLTEKLDSAVARVHAPGGKGATGKTLVSTYGGKAVWNSRSDSIDWESE